MSEWKVAAHSRFPESSQLIERSAKPAEFLCSLAEALPNDLPPETSLRIDQQLLLFLIDMLCMDPRFCLRRGVTKNLGLLRDRLEHLSYPPRSAAEVARDAAYADAVALSFLRPDRNPREALSWLKAAPRRRTLGELANTAVSVRLINQLYRAGAAKVWAVEIDSYPDGTENTGRLVIELPQDPAARKRVLAWVSHQSLSKGFNPGQDEGESFAYVRLD
jgi:hypothetical protein